MSKRTEGLAFGALTVLALIWGYNWVVMKIATHYAPPIEFAALRLLLGSAVLFGAIAAMRRSLRPDRLWTYAVIGVFQSGAFVALVTWAIVTAGAGKVSILSYTMPLWVAVLAPSFLGEHLHVRHIIALAVAATGILFILNFWDARGSLFADCIALAAGVCWAIGVVLTKRLQLRVNVDALDLTAWQMFFGGLAVGVAALVIPEHATHWTWAYGGALAYNVVLASALAYLLWIFVLGHLPARDASMGTLANPVIGIVAAWLQLGERPSRLELAGMLLVLAALAILAWTPGERSA